MAKDKDSNRNAFITTFFSIVGFVIALLIWKKDKYVMYYAKQSLVIFILSILVSVIKPGLSSLAGIGYVLEVALNLVILLPWLFSWMNALSGKKKRIMLISDFANKINL